MRPRLIILLTALLFIGCNPMDALNEHPITLEARYMQYACGDWNDDMQVKQVIDTDTAYQFLVGKDIDPVILDGASEISGWFFANKTPEYGMTYQLTGYVSRCAESGCDEGAPTFWITEIKRLDGQAFDTSGAP